MATPAQIEAGFSEFVQQMRTNLMAVAGMPNEPGMDKQGEVVSGQAIRRRQFLSDQSHFQYYFAFLTNFRDFSQAKFASLFLEGFFLNEV